MVESGDKLALCNIPKGDELDLGNGSTLYAGKADIDQVYQLPKHRSVSVNGDYIYVLTYRSILRFKPGKNQFESLASVPNLVKDEEAYYEGFDVKDATYFAIAFYDEYYGFYMKSYSVK